MEGLVSVVYCSSFPSAAHLPATAEVQFLKVSSASPAVAASFFFLASIILVVTLVILIPILWKCIKPGTLQKLLRATKKLPGKLLFKETK